MNQNIPTREDWVGIDQNLDRKYAYESFAEKSLDEVELYFKNNIIEACSDIRWMPIKPFQYYLILLKDFIDKGDFGEFSKPDAVNCFLDIILEKLENKRGYILPVITQLLPTIKYITSHQIEFEADIDIYGDFKLTYQKIMDLTRE